MAERVEIEREGRGRMRLWDWIRGKKAVELEECWRGVVSVDDAKRVMRTNPDSFECGTVITKDPFTFVIMKTTVLGREEVGFGFAKRNKDMDEPDWQVGLKVAGSRASL